jgi:hypothetical protein
MRDEATERAKTVVEDGDEKRPKRGEVGSEEDREP